MRPAFYRSETVAFDKHPDQYVYHEHLQEYNRAYYFNEFVSEAQKHSLQFLGESDLPSNWIGKLNEKAKSKLEKVNDLVLRSHGMDCIINRTFRESFLVHSDTKIDRNISTDLLASARFSGSFNPTEPSENPNPTAENKPKCFKLASGRVLTTSERSTQLAAELLDQVFPCSLPTAELHRQIEDRLEKESIPSKIELKQLAASMIQWSLSGWIQFRFLDDCMKSDGFHKPKTTAWACSQARVGDLVTNQGHNTMSFGSAARIAWCLPFSTELATWIRLRAKWNCWFDRELST